MNKLSQRDRTRFARHLNLQLVGEAGQEKFKAARVLVVGAGGLGCPILQYLAAAGIGHIGIVDNDTVDESNLQRQILFGEADVGLRKAAVARARVAAINSEITIEAFVERLNPDNAERILKGYDVVVDGTDNFATKYLINDACFLYGKPLVYGSVNEFEGQVAVFNVRDSNGQRSTNYRDLYPSPPPAGLSQNCAEGGVLGVLPGLIGLIQANEVLKLVLGIGNVLVDQVLTVDGLGMEFHVMRINPRATNPLSGRTRSITQLVEMDWSCAIDLPDGVGLIDCASMRALIGEEHDTVLIDVRGVDEHASWSLGGLNIPVSDLESRLSEIDLKKEVIFYCKSGVRSLKAASLVATKAPGVKVRSLAGGVDRYRSLMVEGA